jgi:hypothetical protein
LPEKLVQQAIHKNLDPSKWIREYPVGLGYLDLLSHEYAIEIKKSTGSNPSYNTLGQILYYREGLRLQGSDREGVILIYGSSFEKYGDPVLTSLRKQNRIRLWLLSSLANFEVLDLDSGEVIPVIIS